MPGGSSTRWSFYLLTRLIGCTLLSRCTHATLWLLVRLGSATRNQHQCSWPQADSLQASYNQRQPLATNPPHHGPAAGALRAASSLCTSPAGMCSFVLIMGEVTVNLEGLGLVMLSQAALRL
eukprot:350500-Chlamydomonas_euryale.AAC.22